MQGNVIIPILQCLIVCEQNLVIKLQILAALITDGGSQFLLVILWVAGGRFCISSFVFSVLYIYIEMETDS